MRKMESKSSGKKNKGTRTQGMVSNKLDFLLDTIDTEVANLAESVVTQGPILYETDSNDDPSAMGLSQETTVMDHRDLNVGLFENPGEPPSDLELMDKETEAALEALRDAEGEVEAILTAEGLAGNTEDATPKVADKEEDNQPATKTLAEFLATGELDPASLLVKEKELGKSASAPNAADGELSEDLFFSLDKPSESDNDTPPVWDSGPRQGKATDGFLAETRQEGAVESLQLKADESCSSPASSDCELAALMSNKIEALLTRLVEERLPAIAERIIVEKLNKIIASME